METKINEILIDVDWYGGMSYIAVYVNAIYQDRVVCFTVNCNFKAEDCIDYELYYCETNVPKGYVPVDYDCSSAMLKLRIHDLPEPIIDEIDYKDDDVKRLLNINDELEYCKIKNDILSKASEVLYKELESYIYKHVDELKIK